MSVLERTDDLADDPPQPVLPVASTIAGRDGRDEVEPGSSSCAGDAALVTDDVAPQDRSQLQPEPASHLAAQSLVALQRVVQLLARHAVRDRRHGVEPQLAVCAGVAA